MSICEAAVVAHEVGLQCGDAPRLLDPSGADGGSNALDEKDDGDERRHVECVSGLR